jgi:hypothetical protein
MKAREVIENNETGVVILPMAEIWKLKRMEQACQAR